MLLVLLCLSLNMSCTSTVTTKENADLNNREPVAITLWWIIFNYPENCSDNSCGANDLVDGPEIEDSEKVQASVVYGTGQLTDKNGNVTLVSHLYPTDIDLGNYGPAHSNGMLEPLGKGLQNVEGAEIHLFINSSGPVIDEYVDEQLTTLSNASCDTQGGPNHCRYIQEAVHKPGKSTANVFVIGKPEQIIESASSTIYSDGIGLKVIVRTSIDL